MAKNGEVTGITALKLPEGLARLLAGAAEGSQKPRSIDEVIKVQDEAIRSVLHGCQDPEHKKAHDALTVLLKAMYKFDTVPVRVRDVTASFLAHDALHFLDDENTLGDNLQLLFGDKPYFSTMVLFAATIAAVYERPDLMQAVPVADKPVGQYL